MADFQFFRSEEAKTAGVNLKLPRSGDAGFDLPALKTTEILPKNSALVSTGIHVAIPLGWVGIVRDRSSTAMKGIMCGAGVIDASYRGEIKVLLWNLSNETITFQPGDRIAQLVCMQHLTADGAVEVEELEKLGSTERGAAGFGSTGK
jgi:dUTP pyrophosphatase